MYIVYYRHWVCMDSMSLPTNAHGVYYSSTELSLQNPASRNDIEQRVAYF